jgi:hypothetical protein
MTAAEIGPWNGSPNFESFLARLTWPYSGLTMQADAV